MKATVRPLTPPSGREQLSGMDRAIERHHRLPWRWLLLGAFGLVTVVFLLLFIRPDRGQSLRIETQRLTISPVTRGTFEDFIPIRGRLTPRRTVFLDAIEGGRVEEVLVEDGAVVTADQLLLRLSNSRLQLDVISREAQITEQQNNLNALELSLERNRLEHKRGLNQADYEVARLTRLVERRQRLSSDGLVSAEELADLEDELRFWRRDREVRIEAQSSDERLQRAQLVQIRDSVNQLKKNLAIARSNLDSLNVRAPRAGKLTAFSVEIGQSLGQGERFGQVDDPASFKLTALIDEYYLNRVDLEQRARISTDDDTFELFISKIYPQVRDGQFEIDMSFTEDQPLDARRGQTLQARLFLGDPASALLIPNGAFYQDTGGKWIFVVTADGAQAVRRELTLGRRNARFIEVLDGLDEGEQVITSPYVNYPDIQRLTLARPDSGT